MAKKPESDLTKQIDEKVIAVEKIRVEARVYVVTDGDESEI